MSSESQTEFEFDLPLPPTAQPPVPAKLDLSLKASPARPLGPAQEEFNKRLKALERARAAHERKRARLDKDLATCREVLMPLVEKCNQYECRIAFAFHEARGNYKFTKRRTAALDHLLLAKIEDLLGDSTGLGEEDVARLEDIHDEIDPPVDEEEPGEEEKAAMREEFDAMRAVIEGFARSAGVNLDLGGLDPDMDPDEMTEEFQRRLIAAEAEYEQSVAGNRKPRRKRKPSKAALERERLRLEAEEAKKRDFKTLYKQLAKVLHPDLETDPVLKEHKEAWMKRLTDANARGDLREMLAIEVEWLGEEEGNLANATDEKLRVYAMVLKEQLGELKEQTRFLAHQPEYTPLRRFLGPFDDRLNTFGIQMHLEEEIAELSDLCDTLRSGGPAARALINRSADAHARSIGL